MSIFQRKLSDKQRLWFARFFVIAIVSLTFVLSLVLPRSVFELGIWAFAGFTGLFPLVVAGLYWRRVTALGAIAATVVTAVSWSVLFTRSNFGGNKGYTFPESPISLSLFEIPPMNPIATVTALSAITLNVVSLITKQPKEETIKRFF